MKLKVKIMNIIEEIKRDPGSWDKVIEVLGMKI